MKKSNQKSLGEDPETPYASVRPDRKVYDLPDLGLDDAYKVFILIRSLLAAGSKIKCAAGTLRAYLRRRTDDVKASFVSSRSLASKGFAKGKAWFPFALFCFLLQEQKEGPRGERC